MKFGWHSGIRSMHIPWMLIGNDTHSNLFEHTMQPKRPPFVRWRIFSDAMQPMHSRTRNKVQEHGKKWQLASVSRDTVNRKIKITDDTVVISHIFVDNIVFYVHASLKCATLFT